MFQTFIVGISMIKKKLQNISNYFTLTVSAIIIKIKREKGLKDLMS